MYICIYVYIYICITSIHFCNVYKWILHNITMIIIYYNNILYNINTLQLCIIIHYTIFSICINIYIYYIIGT